MKTSQLPAEHFTALDAVGSIVHGFTLRVAGVETSCDKAEVVGRLDAVHREVLKENGLKDTPFVTAQQVHGANVMVVGPTTEDRCFDDSDGLVTDQPGVCLGIYVADCCAVFLVDPKRKAIGLVHSGKKGTELRIVSNAIEMMRKSFGSDAADLVVQLSPCIRPPHYETNFAGAIVGECCELGVKAVNDRGVCTACNLGRYYSYRAEKGQTGRMLAFLALA